jgi:hypothetical protein
VTASPGERVPRPPGAGLCETCEHRRLVRNTRGSTFSLCLLSRVEDSYPRYPRLPVLECPGYHRRGSDGGDLG